MNEEFKKSLGFYLIVGTAFVSGVSVFLNKFALGYFASSSVFAVAKNTIVAVLLTSLVFGFKKIPEMASYGRKNWAYIIAISVCGGSVPFLLFFKGLSLTSAGGAALMHKTLFIWVTVMAVIFLKEKISFYQISAMALLAAGVLFYVLPADLSFGYGEFLILGATLLWAVENVLAKMVLKEISALSLAWGRMFFGSLFLIAFMAATGQVTNIFVMDSWSQAGWLILTGCLLLAYNILYYSAVQRIPVSVAASFLVLAYPITSFFESLVSSVGFEDFPFLPFAFIIFGIAILCRLAGKTRSFIKKGIPSWKAY